MSAGKNTQHEQPTTQESVEADSPATEQEQSAGQTAAATEPAAEAVQDSENEALMQDLEQSQKELAAFKDQYLRARAEMENIRRRAQEEIAKTRKFAVEGFAESLLPVRDSLEAALGQQEQTIEDVLEGVETTLRQLDRVFERHQLEEIAPEIGAAFDPNLHQAISTIASEQEKGSVAQVLQKGYVLSDRVLRPAMVMVSAGQE